MLLVSGLSSTCSMVQWFPRTEQPTSPFAIVLFGRVVVFRQSAMTCLVSGGQCLIHVIVSDPSCRYIGPRTSILYSAIAFFDKLLCSPTGVCSTTASFEEVAFCKLVSPSFLSVQRNAYIVALIKILLLHWYLVSPLCKHGGTWSSRCPQSQP
jgi:hypothetical protein